MKLLRAATLTVVDPIATAERFVQWMDYRIVEQDTVSTALAQSWGAPASAGRRYVIVAPASGASVYLRFVAGDAVPTYRPLRTYGWAAIELCVQDVLATNARMTRSPFEIIGPPQEIAGLTSIYPMQVKGPDQEIVYLTQIRGDLPSYDLPRAACAIDKLFLLVIGCRDLDESSRWFERTLGLSPGRKLDIVYSMLSTAFDLPPDQLHTIATVTHARDVILELDQYPSAATERPMHSGQLPPGISICTLAHPDIDNIQDSWITPLEQRQGLIYGSARAGVLRTPDGALVEVVDARALQE